MSSVIYLMRHGIAADPAPGMSDADRALTPDGVRKTVRVAAGLAKLGVKPDVILSSPLRRAEETAHLVADALDGRAAPAKGLTLERVIYPKSDGGPSSARGRASDTTQSTATETKEQES